MHCVLIQLFHAVDPLWSAEFAKRLIGRFALCPLADVSIFQTFRDFSHCYKLYYTGSPFDERASVRHGASKLHVRQVECVLVMTNLLALYPFVRVVALLNSNYNQSYQL